MKVLITGICGFIGTNLALYLDRLGYDVMGVDISFYKPNHAALVRKGIDVRIGDVLVLRDLMRHSSEGIDAVVHLAAKTDARTSYPDADQMLRTNVLGSYNVTRASLERRVEKLIFASSGAVYGHCKGQKWHPYLSFCKPVNVYGLTKLMGEQFFDAAQEESPNGCDVYKLRMANVYGPWCGNKNSFIALMVKSLLFDLSLTIHGTGVQRRDFIYVKDLCEKIEKCLNSDLTPGTYNMATGKSISINQILTELGNITGIEIEPEYDGEADYGVDDVSFDICNLARCGLSPNRTLEDGLRETWKWAKKENFIK